MRTKTGSEGIAENSHRDAAEDGSSNSGNTGVTNVDDGHVKVVTHNRDLFLRTIQTT